jgi:hypothetical protein
LTNHNKATHDYKTRINHSHSDFPNHV